MNELINFDDVNSRIITIRNQNVILDADVAALYGVQTMHVNQAVKNNPKKFPDGYVFQLKVNELDGLEALCSVSKSSDNQGAIKNFDRPLIVSKLSSVLPKAFTEKGLYMLATILKSERAIEATIAIVEAFAKMRELANNLAILNTMDPEIVEPEIIESTGSLLDELLFSGIPTSAKTSMELNLGLIKLRREITSGRGEACSTPMVSQNEFQELKKMIENIQNQLQHRS